MRVLVIEDDPATADYIARGLTQEGHTAEVARTGKDGLFLAMSEQFDVIVTDRMLPAPGRAGHRACAPGFVHSHPRAGVDGTRRGGPAGGGARRGRGRLPGQAVRLLRAPRPGPCAGPPRRPPRRALPRPNSPSAALRMDLLRRAVDADWQAVVELLPTEWRLLEYMMRHPGQVLTRTMLLERVWDFRLRPHDQRGRRACQPPAPQAGGLRWAAV